MRPRGFPPRHQAVARHVVFVRMDVYGFCLALGGTGLAAMAIGGLAHVGHDGHGHAGHGDGHGGRTCPRRPRPHRRAPCRPRTGAHADGAHAHSAPAHPAPAHGSWFFSLFSPRVLFALLVGFGAGGSCSRRRSVSRGAPAPRCSPRRPSRGCSSAHSGACSSDSSRRPRPRSRAPSRTMREP